MAKFEIIADESDFIVALKPAGMSFHSESGAGFVVQLEAQLQIKLFSVHRLDKVTSGLLIFAKSSAAANRFSELFTNRAIDKVYLALIANKPNKKQGWIKGDMSKARRGAHKLLKSQDNPAITRFYTASIEAGIRGAILKPFTGKTHQLRVAMKSISAPIYGDELYGSEVADRVYLHAYALRFQWHGKIYQYQAMPSEGKQFLKLINHEVFIKWKNPWSLEW
ncbi:tRNA pseudouridine32 synthase / 23S rRNA pseudouridine746 synthase [Pseudoalteromonas citrea]|uniref:tRNA pseudouridine32 synthase / 23S rRNA pseudouridine746 synthase n=2 Tax=Pseudoalteromonas citrea TaxID=43655 RepID=A0AAD4AHL8_9GAMM|nr:TIGR01621 family pseudouridine synthase [Pseudoalteromonas citrea]KAF7769770.1 tRNA pseudouridine32 synthase / 23S rRNA pseudouridine746 synthase [Pseudoalteromonas citrea]